MQDGCRSALTTPLQIPFSRISRIGLPGCLRRVDATAGQMFQLPPPVEFFDEATRFAPVGLHLDVEFEKNLSAQHALNLQTRGGTNSFQHLALLADQDAFLAVAFAIDGCGNARELRAFFEVVNNYGGGVGKFLLSFEQDALANDLPSHESRGLIGNLILWEYRRAGGQGCHYLL